MKVQPGDYLSPSSSAAPPGSPALVPQCLTSVSNAPQLPPGGNAADTTPLLKEIVAQGAPSPAADRFRTGHAAEAEAAWLETYFPAVESEDIYFFARQWQVSDLISVAAILEAVADKLDRYRDVPCSEVYLLRAMPEKFINLRDKTMGNWKGACGAINNRHDIARVPVKDESIRLPTNFMHARDLAHGGINFLVALRDKAHTNPYLKKDDLAICCRLSDVFAVNGRIHTDYGSSIPNCIVAELPGGSVIPFELAENGEMPQ